MINMIKIIIDEQAESYLHNNCRVTDYKRVKVFVR